MILQSQPPKCWDSKCVLQHQAKTRFSWLYNMLEVLEIHCSDSQKVLLPLLCRFENCQSNHLVRKLSSEPRQHEPNPCRTSSHLVVIDNEQVKHWFSSGPTTHACSSLPPVGYVRNCMHMSRWLRKERPLFLRSVELGNSIPGAEDQMCYQLTTRLHLWKGHSSLRSLISCMNHSFIPPPSSNLPVYHNGDLSDLPSWLSTVSLPQAPSSVKLLHSINGKDQ